MNEVKWKLSDLYNFFLKNCLIDFRERGRGEEREREKHQFVVPLIYAFIG